MKLGTSVAARTLALLLFLGTGVLAQGELDGLGRRMRAAKGKVFPALVHIVNVEESFVGGRRSKRVSNGSGFLIDAEGHIVTNYHVAGSGKRLIVTLATKRKLPARLIASDRYTDLALVKVDPKRAFAGGVVPFARFGDSSRLEEGEFVMAMGSPLSLSRSVSFGVISARERALGRLGLGDGAETGKYNTWLQTDAAINPGNSGGPLVNLAGEVIGVNTRANLAADNIGFAIPSNVVREVVEAFLEHGRVQRAYLGLSLQPVEELADTALGSGGEGALIGAVAPGSPAAGAGLRPGDLLTRLNNEPFEARFAEQIPSLYRRISKLPLGQMARLTVRRGEQVAVITVSPEQLGRQLGRETDVAGWGITVRGITPRMKRELGLPSVAGVLVTGVRAGGAAAGKLETGDILLEVQARSVKDFGSFLQIAADSIRVKETLVRLIVRRGAVVDVAVLRPEAKK